MSSEDLAPGQDWLSDLIQQTDDVYAAILCLTPENVKSPWILFEAGALLKSTPKGHVIPFTLFLQPSDAGHPLSALNGLSVDRAGTRKLVDQLAKLAGDPPVTEAHREEFDVWFTRFDQAIRTIPRQVPAQDFLRLVKASEFDYPELFASFSAQESQALHNRLDQLADGFVRLYSSEVERFESELFAYLERGSLHRIDAADLTTNPEVLLNRGKRRLSRKKFVDSGGRIRRVLIVEKARLTNSAFRKALCTHIRQEREDGVELGLAMRDHLAGPQIQDFILYDDFAAMVEQVQADRGYVGGSSQLLFKSRDVHHYHQIFDSLWVGDSLNDGQLPLPVRLALALLRIDDQIRDERSSAAEVKGKVEHLSQEQIRGYGA